MDFEKLKDMMAMDKNGDIHVEYGSLPTELGINPFNKTDIFVLDLIAQGLSVCVKHPIDYHERREYLDGIAFMGFLVYEKVLKDFLIKKLDISKDEAAGITEKLFEECTELDYTKCRGEDD